MRGAWQGLPEATQLLVEGMLMKLLAQSPDGTLMCCANDTHLKFVDSRFLKLYETNTPGERRDLCRSLRLLLPCACCLLPVRFLKLYETNTPGAIMAASFHPQKYELFLKIDNRTLVTRKPLMAVKLKAINQPLMAVKLKSR